jgi:CBS domain-containing protein
MSDIDAKPTSLAPETPVGDVMSSGVVALPDDATIGACAAAMFERHTHAVLILDGRTRRPLGWLLHREVLRHLRSDPLTTLAAEAISHEPATIHPEASIEEAVDRMVGEGLSHLLVAVAPDAPPAGVLSTWDVVGYYARLYGHGY